MLTKVFFTLAVIIVVALVFRTKQAAQTAPAPKQSSDQGSLSTRIVAYFILGALVVISITVFVVDYRSDNQIIDIRVIAEDGIGTMYQARQKSIKGRRFVTLDGKQVTLGESDRIEIQKQ
jgi:hypothetical protein